MSTHTNAIPWETGNDEMERLALEECAKRQRIDHSVSVLILPADQCDLAFRFAQLGAVVTVADAPEKQQEIEHYYKLYREQLSANAADRARGE